MSLSKAELDSKAQATVAGIYEGINSAKLVKDVCNIYLRYCNSSEAKQAGIRPRKVDCEMENRLLFEMLCFSVFITSAIIPNYVSSRKFFAKQTDWQLAYFFNNRVADHLCKLCEKESLANLREIVLVSIKPEVEYRQGDPVDVLSRLIQYSKRRAEDQGAEVEYFGKQIGKCLDPKRYPIFDIIGGEASLPLVRISGKVMQIIFE